MEEEEEPDSASDPDAEYNEFKCGGWDRKKKTKLGSRPHHAERWKASMTKRIGFVKMMDTTHGGVYVVPFARVQTGVTTMLMHGPARCHYGSIILSQESGVQERSRDESG